VVQDLLFSIKTSGAEKSFMLAMASPERSFRYVAFPFNAFPDDQYRAFGLENAHLFTRMKLSRITIRSGERDAKAIRDRILADPSAFEESARSHSQDGFADKGGEMGFREYQELKDASKTRRPRCRFRSRSGRDRGAIQDLLRMDHLPLR
jgi:hypothetical protein